jgi:hypothetical protein
MKLIKIARKITKKSNEMLEDQEEQEETSLEDHPDFVGYHCRKAEWNEYGGIIHANPHYIKEWYWEIIESMPFDIRDKLLEQNMNEFERSGYDDIDEWGQEIEHFLYENGIRWIFVKDQEPEYDYGAWCYHVLMPESNRLAYLNDPYETNSSVIIYQAKNPPNMIEVPD